MSFKGLNREAILELPNLLLLELVKLWRQEVSKIAENQAKREAETRFPDCPEFLTSCFKGYVF